MQERAPRRSTGISTKIPKNGKRNITLIIIIDHRPPTIRPELKVDGIGEARSGNITPEMPETGMVPDEPLWG